MVRLTYSILDFFEVTDLLQEIRNYNTGNYAINKLLDTFPLYGIMGVDLVFTLLLKEVRYE